MGDVTTEVKSRPILFSGPMVRAILEGRKTQTRRVVKPQPNVSANWTRTGFHDGAAFIFPDPKTHPIDEGSYCKIRSPYGDIGDELWVREAWCYGDGTGEPDPSGLREETEKRSIHFKADWAGIDEDVKWNSPLFMPRRASRLKLIIESLRLEPLCAISESDAKAEGMTVPLTEMKYAHEFYLLWEKLNGKRHPWLSNPWVWVIGFPRIDQLRGGSDGVGG